MQQVELTPEQVNMLENAAEGSGLQFHPDYSGRGMYGQTCIGVVGLTSDLLAFVLEVAEHDKELAQDELTQVSKDNMATSTIFYWPRLTVARGTD